jgi:DNA-directed RNA polymerase-3 subunit RPC5
LNSQTFGGQILKDDGKGPSYMLGTFRDGRLFGLCVETAH